MSSDPQEDRATASPQPAGGLRPQPRAASSPIGAHQAQGSDMDRAFRIAILTLNFDLKRSAAARRFYADGLNNHAGYLSPYMAARVIAATMAARQAIALERNSIAQWLFEEADYARQGQQNAAAGHPDKLYRMGQKDGLLLAAATVRDGLALPHPSKESE